jgi:ankyrin repeat protein
MVDVEDSISASLTDAESDGLCMAKKTCTDTTKMEQLKVSKCSYCGAKQWNILGDADTGYVLTTSIGDDNDNDENKSDTSAGTLPSTCIVRKDDMVMTAPCESSEVPYTPLQLRFATRADLVSMGSVIARFIAAAVENNLSFIQEAITANPEIVHEKDWDGLTALIPAASAGHVQVCQYLIEQGSDMNTSDKDGITALMEASIMGHVPVVELLLQKGATLEATANSDVTALWLAASEGQTAVVQYLLSMGASASNTRNDGITALMSASIGGHYDVVRLLVEHGADVTVTDMDGSTPLMNAAENGTMAIVELISTTAQFDPKYMNAISKSGYTALIIAAAHGHTDIVRYLLEHQADANTVSETQVTAFMYAAASNRVDVMKVLVEVGKVDIEMKHNNGGTALLEAATGSAVEALQYLIQIGAQIDFVDDDGVTPLMAIASLGSYEGQQLVLEALKTKFSDTELTTYINLHSYSGGSTIMFATAGGHYNITKQLHELGGNPHAIARATPDYLVKLQANIEAGKVNPDEEPHIDGVTALHVAAQGGHMDVVRYLIDVAKVDVTIVDDAGRTPLSMAIKGNYNEVAKVLVKAGGNPNLPYIDDKNVSHNLLFDAIMIENEDFATLLIEHGADLYYVDEKKVSTLLQASHRGLTKIVDALLTKYAKDVAAGAAKENYLNESSEDGITPLIAASSEGHTDVVKSLLAAKVDIEVKDSDATTALMTASARGHVSIVEVLLSAGALVNEQNTDGHTALMFAYSGKNQVVTLWTRYQQYVAEHAEKSSSASSTSTSTDKRDLMDVDDNGTGQIIREALDKHVALVELLIKVGRADLHLKDKEGHKAKDFDYNPDSDTDLMDKAKKTTKLLDESKNEL